MKKAFVTVGVLVGAILLSSAPLAEPPAPRVQAPSLAADGAWTPGESPFTVEEIVRDGDRALLRVRNRTPFMVIMHIGGVRVGWMRPYRTGLLRGLVPGYHKLYAHSRFGSMSWGPREIWVPGTWNLLY